MRPVKLTRLKLWQLWQLQHVEYVFQLQQIKHVHPSTPHFQVIVISSPLPQQFSFASFRLVCSISISSPHFPSYSCCASFSFCVQLVHAMCPSHPPLDLTLTSTLLLVFPTFHFVSFHSALALPRASIKYTKKKNMWSTNSIVHSWIRNVT